MLNRVHWRQAPAGIGKSSMLKYMCMKWGCNELWGSNFDVLIFVECRTLNRLGSMTGTQFLDKVDLPRLNRTPCKLIFVVYVY